jgi:SOS-response transcriptional repressor LexA
MTQSPQLKREGLHDKDRALLRHIDRFIREHGFSPSLRELQVLGGYSSTSMTAAAVVRLEKVGAIARKAGTSRTIVVLDGGFGEG